MPKLSKEAKQRLQQLFKGGQFAIRWGFIPVVLYLGQITSLISQVADPQFLSQVKMQVLREVQILECLSQLSGVYFGDEGCGGRVLEPADEQRVSEDTYIPEDGADT